MRLTLFPISTLLKPVLASKLATRRAARRPVVSDSQDKTAPALQKRGLQRMGSSVRATARKSLRALLGSIRVIAFSEVAAFALPDLSLDLSTIVWQTSMDRCLISSRLAPRQGIAGAPCADFELRDIGYGRVALHDKHRISITQKVATGENHAV
jgi:hypothetical protein